MARQIELTERLREADRRKDEFLALLAHELRNPLAPVVNAVNIMRLKEPRCRPAQWCRDVIERQAGQHLTRLVDDLLDVSRITWARSSCARAGGPGQGDRRRARAEPPAHRRPPPRADHRPARPTPVVLQGDRRGSPRWWRTSSPTRPSTRTTAGGMDLIVEQRDGTRCITVRDNGIGIPPRCSPRSSSLFAQGERSGWTGPRAGSASGCRW